MGPRPGTAGATAGNNGGSSSCDSRAPTGSVGPVAVGFPGLDSY